MKLNLHCKHIVHFRAQLSKLPDKGEKLAALYDRALAAVSAQNDMEDASKLLEKLSITTKDVNEMEWNNSKKAVNAPQVELDSDDEDPLAILASSNTTTGNQRIIRVIEDQQDSLITAEDLKDAQEVKKLIFDPVMESLCKNENMEPSHRFIPSKQYPSKSNSSSLNGSSLSIASKLRDNTSATPPVCAHTIKQLTLRESMELENSHLIRMQEIREQQAVERLAARSKDVKIATTKTMSIDGEKIKDLESSLMTKYRDVVDLLEGGGAGSDEESNDSNVEEDYGE